MNEDVSKKITKIKSTTVTEKIVEQMMSMIESGVFKPGDTLPTETDLSSRLGVGRSSVREALKHLQAIGIIEKSHGNTARFSQTCANSAAQYFNLPNILNNFTLIELSDARETIEVSLAGLSAKNASEKQIVSLKKAIDEFDQAVEDKNYDTILDLDFEFHKRIADSSGNSFLAQMLMMLHDLIIAGNKRTLSENHVALAGKNHRQILEKIEQRDVEGVKKAMKKHMDEIREKFN